MAKREGTAVGRRASRTQEERSAAAEQDYPENERHSRSEIGRVSEQEPVADRKNPPSMQEVFGPGGLLERCMIGGYEHRRAQLLMAELVQDAFESRHHVVVEAGTGTGKTLAYLLPAICSGHRRSRLKY